GKEQVFVDDELKARFALLQGRPAPPLHAAAWVNSAPRTLEQLRGKVVLIDFWGMGCGPCVAVLPGVQRTADQFAPKGVVVIDREGKLAFLGSSLAEAVGCLGGLVGTGR